jgi:mitosis inhibitor protein kinase SWE1
MSSYYRPSPRFASEHNPFESPVLTPSPLRQRPLFPTPASPMKDSDDLFSQSPYTSPNNSISIPQPISADDEEGSIFLSSPPFSAPPASTSRLLVTPVKQSHRPRARTALTEKHFNVPRSPLSEFSSGSQVPRARIGVGTKRKTEPQATTPLRQHNLAPLKLASCTAEDRVSSPFHFDRLAPLPTPKTCARTPQTTAEADFHLTNQTSTLKHLRITDRNNSADEFASHANDSASDVDDDEANTLFYSNARMKNKVTNAGKLAGRVFVNKDRFKDEVVEAISPGGHITKRRARSRPVSAELKQLVHSPNSPGPVSYIVVTQMACTHRHGLDPRFSHQYGTFESPELYHFPLNSFSFILKLVSF